jgi:septal ring factor EnvC (AmiA/AmiB activator)
VEQPDIVQQLVVGLKLESLAVKISNPFLVEAAKQAIDEIEALREELEQWRNAWEAERLEHEATMKAWDEERSS